MTPSHGAGPGPTSTGRSCCSFPPVPGWPYYARPRRGAAPVTAADIRAVRARQRELIIPESFEWIEQVAPEMAAAAAEAGLEVQPHPLMVLSAAPPGTGGPVGPRRSRRA